jgi:predicted DNA-binding protein
MSLQIQSTPQVQFPLRMNHELHTRFTKISTATKIPKSTLGRLSITMFLDEIDKKGITTVLKQLENI